jgi:tetratricopeptide (TPR) repeat protein
MIDRRLYLALFAALTLSGAAPAFAESPIEAHFKRGERFFESGRFQNAAKEFQAAYDLEPNPLLLLNIGHCFRKAGDTDMAIHLYRRFLENAPTKLARERELAEQRIAELEAGRARAVASLLSPPQVPAPAPPVYKRWWFWTSIALAATAGTVAVIAARLPRELDIPSTPLGTHEAR